MTLLIEQYQAIKKKERKKDDIDYLIFIRDLQYILKCAMWEITVEVLAAVVIALFYSIGVAVREKSSNDIINDSNCGSGSNIDWF